MTLDEPEKMQVLKSKSRTPNYIKDWTLQITEDEKTGHTQAHNMPTIRLFPILTMETIKSTLFIHIHFGHFGLLIRLKRLISRWSNFPWPISLGQSLAEKWPGTLSFLFQKFLGYMYLLKKPSRFCLRHIYPNYTVHMTLYYSMLHPVLLSHATFSQH